MTAQLTTGDSRQGDSAGILADVRAVFRTGRTRPAEWRERQLRGVELMCAEREAEISAALTEDLR